MGGDFGTRCGGTQAMEYAFGHMMPVRDRARFLPLYDAMAAAVAGGDGGGGLGVGAEGGVERNREFHLRSTFVHKTKTRPWTASHQRRVTAAATTAAGSPSSSTSLAFGSGASTARAAVPTSPSAMTAPSPRALLGAEASPARPQTAPLQLSPHARCAPFAVTCLPVCLFEKRAHPHASAGRRMEVAWHVHMPGERACGCTQLRGRVSESAWTRHSETPSAQTRQSRQFFAVLTRW